MAHVLQALFAHLGSTEGIIMYSAEVLVEQPPHHEVEKSFDVLASVNRLRFDMQQFGKVLPETLERVRDEELSLLAEGVDRVARTEFKLKREGGDIQYFKDGQWQPYTGMLLAGERVAKQEAARDYRKQFLADAAVRDLMIGYKMRALQPNEQYVWASPYPYDVEEKYGASFLRDECGRSPDRKMAFLYRAYCEDDGTILLESQTIDKSDDEALAAALKAARSESTANLDDMVEANDAVMARKYGGEYYAGRREAEVRENAWQTIVQEQDLTEYLLSGLESIAATQLYGKELENTVKRHMYGVWAALSKRVAVNGARRMYDYRDATVASVVPVVHYALVAQEIEQAFSHFVTEGRVMAGCGGSIKILNGEEEILAAESGDVFASLFGSNEDKYGSLEFKCTKGHNNRRPRGKLIENCQVCKTSVRC